MRLHASLRRMVLEGVVTTLPVLTSHVSTVTYSVCACTDVTKNTPMHAMRVRICMAHRVVATVWIVAHWGRMYMGAPVGD